MGFRWGRVCAVLTVTVLTSLFLTFPRSAEAQEELQEFPATLKADSYKFDRQARILTAQGNVVFTTRDVTIRADVLVADLQTSLVSAEGHVRLDAAGQSVLADMLTYNLGTRTGTLFNAHTEYRSPWVLGAVTLKAEEMASDVKQFVTIRKGYATTCEEPDPVVFATAAELSIFPGDKIVGRQVSLWVAGHRLFTVPFFMIFLRERRDTRIAPTVGYSDAEGWFIRTSWAYFLNERHYGFVHADWFERLGVGTGIEHLYKTGAAEGSVLLYWLANRQTGGADQHAVVNHLQRLGDVTARLFADYDESSSMLGLPTSGFFVAADISTQSPWSSTYLFSTLTQSSLGPVSFLTSRLAHTQNLGPRLAADVLLDYSQNAGPAGIDEELFPRFTLRYFGENMTATLVTETRWDLDGDRFTADDRYTLERLPELTLTLNAFNIGDTPLWGSATAGLAQFRETIPGPTGGVLDAGRADVQVTVSGPLPLAGGTVGMRTFARQTWYTTGDARFFYGGRLEYARAVASAFEARVGYTAQTAVGASPFVFDQIAGTLSVADAQLTFHTQAMLLRATAFYDFQSEQFGDIVGQAFFQPRPDWSIGFAGSYNVNIGQLDRVEAALDVQLSKEWRFEYSGAWDSFTQSVQNNRVSVTRTFCECMAMSLTYLGARQEIWLEAWLTAIPWGRGKIGIGGQGTLLFEQPWWLMPQR